jgi:hypothetical protein
MDWFGPTQKCLINLNNILNLEWFWGSLTSFRSQNILENKNILGIFKNKILKKKVKNKIK